jgi:hypothetical protein
VHLRFELEPSIGQLTVLTLSWPTSSSSLCTERVKKETWEQWASADIAQQSRQAGAPGKMPREWLKSLVIDGGTRYGHNAYVIYSSGKVELCLLASL